MRGTKTSQEIWLFIKKMTNITFEFFYFKKSSENSLEDLNSEIYLL